jgi:hypothetical protein
MDAETALILSVVCLLLAAGLGAWRGDLADYCACKWNEWQVARARRRMPDLHRRSARAEVLPLDRARRELADRARRRLCEVSTLRTAITRNTDDAA